VKLAKSCVVRMLKMSRCLDEKAVMATGTDSMFCSRF
jgi:hypothetical protein